jgi:hypothetical protein
MAKAQVKKVKAQVSCLEAADTVFDIEQKVRRAGSLMYKSNEVSRLKP